MSKHNSPPRLRLPNESIEDYRVAMGWDEPKNYTWEELGQAIKNYEEPENREYIRELDRQRLERVLKSFPNITYNFKE